MVERLIHPAILFFASLLFFPIVARSQSGAPSFEAFADAQEVFKDNYFQVTFTLRNAEGSEFRPPDFKDFRIISGPSRGMSTTIINGQVRMEASYSYVLQPRRTGKLYIGSASIKGVIDRIGRNFRSQPIAITVLEQKSGESGDAPDYFVRASLNVGEAYVGQQVRLDYTLFTTVEVQHFNIVEESPYLNFYAEDLSGINPQVKREIINGREYYSQVLKSLSLYPQKAGMLTIQPASLQLGIVTDAGAESFFFGADIKRVGVSTAPVMLKVRPLPSGPPVSFSGAVGDFSFEASLDRNIATTDDAFRLMLAVTGDGDLKRVEAPGLQGVDSFDIYEPRVKEENYGESGGKRVGRKVFEYLLAPRATGKFRLAPVFSYFSPQKGTYSTLAPQVFEVEVRQGRLPAKQLEGSRDVPESSTGLMEVQDLSMGKKRWVQQPVFWAALFLPFLAFGVVVGAKHYRRRFGSGVRHRSGDIGKVAEKWLETAARHLHKGESRYFYEAVSNAFLQYLSQRLQVPLSEQSQARLLEQLERQGLGQPLVDTFRQILKNCELALYAGMDNSAAMEETYRNAIGALEALEHFFQEKKKAGIA